MPKKDTNFKNAQNVIEAWLNCLQGEKNGKKLLPSQMMGLNAWQSTHIENCIEMKFFDKETTTDEFEKLLEGQNLNKPLKVSYDADKKLLKQILDVKNKKYNGADNFEEFIALICDAMYLHYCFVNSNPETIKKKIKLICDFFKIECNNDFKKLESYSLVNAGQHYNQIRWGGIYFYAKLASLYKDKNDVEDFLNNPSDDQLEAFTKSLKDAQYGTYQIIKDNKYSSHLNILLAVKYPKNFALIHSSTDKYLIVKVFKELLKELLKDKNGNGKTTVDKELKGISEELKKINESLFDKETGWAKFYGDTLKKIWKSSSMKRDFSELQGLQYKKAVILYGPPGTSKTHDANELAKQLISHKHISENKGDLSEILSDDGQKKIIKNRIHSLQLHANYSYEDFIAGMVLKDNKVEPKKGYFLKLCEKIEKDEDKLPHVLILDEINRVDLSRVFGELFSAMEYRESEDKSIKTGIGNFELKIPKNLYIIGTMNEIDFSLERLDFALRRRFVWYFCGYNEATLAEIIEYKNTIPEKQDEEPEKQDEDIQSYIERCTALNKKIEDDEELGEQYQIGHTFFAEIVEIYASYKGMEDKTATIKNAQKILWEISIKPIIEAFLGGIDKKTKQSKLEEFQKAFGL